MALVTFKENVDHYVKGDVLDLDEAELERVDAYAEEHGIEKPYVKGAKTVKTTKGETTQESAAKTTGKSVEEVQKADAKKAAEAKKASEAKGAKTVKKADEKSGDEGSDEGNTEATELDGDGSEPAAE